MSHARLAVNPSSLPSCNRLQRRAQRALIKTDEWIALGLAFGIVARKTVLLRRRATDDYASIDQYAALEIALVGLACLFLITRGYLPRLLTRFHGTSILWLLTFYGWCVASAAWSTNPAYSFFQAVEVISQTLLILLVVAFCGNFRESETRVLQLSATAIVMGLLVPFKLHGLTLNVALWHTNTFSASAAMLFCYSLAEFLRASGPRARQLRNYLVFSGLALLLGTSAASYIATLGGLSIAALLIRGKRWPLVMFLLVLSIAGFTSPDATMDLLFPDKTDQQISTLHGRTYLWSRSFGYAMEGPWIGHGFAMGAKLGESIRTNMHNSLFSVFLGTGAVGCSLALLGNLVLFREVQRSHALRLPGAAGCAAALATGLANSMSMGFLGEAWREITLVFTALLTFHVLTLRGGASKYKYRGGGTRAASTSPFYST